MNRYLVLVIILVADDKARFFADAYRWINTYRYYIRSGLAIVAFSGRGIIVAATVLIKR